MITTVIIENEKKPRELLFALISGYCPRVKVVAQTDDMESGVKAIRTHRPALVFLDILLEPDTGFDVLDQVKEMDFEFIITTAYDDKKYFHKAIDNAVVKYLEKPIDPDDLLAAVSKAESIIDAKRNNGHIHKPNDNFILLPTLKGYEYKHTNEIIRLEAAKTKTVVYLTGRQDVAELNKNIGEMEKELPTEHFFRPHKSHIVNRTHIRKFENNARWGRNIIMSDGSEEAEVSKRKLPDFIEWLRCSQ